METIISTVIGWFLTFIDIVIPGLMILLFIPKGSRLQNTVQSSTNWLGLFIVLMFFFVICKQRHQVQIRDTSAEELTTAAKGEMQP